MEQLSRRGFLKGAATGSIGGMLATTPMMALAEEQAAYTFADTIAWDGEYDVVVMGFGGAGAVAAHFAAKEGASVLLFDAAPEGHEGGNTRYCAQCIAYGDPADKEALGAYYRALCGDMPMDDGVLNTMLDGLVEIPAILAEDYGVAEMHSFRGNERWSWGIPEFPELEGSEAVNVGSINGQSGDGALWELYRSTAHAEKDRIDIWFEARGMKLIQDPQTKTILGVTIERNGEMRAIRARNGVVMACGGFENNPQMVADYLGLARFNYIGTSYNRGDGVRMAIEVGADLWHMANYEGIRHLGGAGLAMEPEERSPYGTPGLPGCELTGGSFILVGAQGKRYVNETYMTRHGHVAVNGEWPHPQHTKTNYVVMDQAHFTSMEETEKLDDLMRSKVIQAETLTDLANATGMDPDALQRTVETYNYYAEQGEDWGYGRKPETMTAIGEGPFYAFPVVARVLNTQGGPRRNANAEVVDTEGNPIPHLYAAGELGGFTAKNYQGGSNMSECLIFGKIAGTNAAQPKDELATYMIAEPVEQNLVYTLGVDTDAGE